MKERMKFSLTKAKNDLKRLWKKFEKAKTRNDKYNVIKLVERKADRYEKLLKSTDDIKSVKELQDIILLYRSTASHMSFELRRLVGDMSDYPYYSILRKYGVGK